MAVETTTPPATESAPPATETPTSLLDHEAQFPRGQRVTQTAIEPPPNGNGEDQAVTPRPRVRHRAASQKAGAEDVPRIKELTAKLRSTEEELTALKAAAKPHAPAAPSVVTPPAVHKPVATTPALTSNPKPDPNDKKYTAGPYDPQYQEDLAEWKYKALREQEREAEAVKAKETQQKAELERVSASWHKRVEAAKQKYPDFQKVALESPTRIPPQSLVDAYILESTDGADVLYYLQRPEHAAELDALLAQSAFEQVKTLTLLGQRLVTPQAGVTGSAAASAPPSVPRPPNPVRTGPMRTADEPPDPASSSLREHEQFYGRRRVR